MTLATALTMTRTPTAVSTAHQGRSIFAYPRPLPWNGMRLTGARSAKYPPIPTTEPSAATITGLEIARAVIVRDDAPRRDRPERRSVSLRAARLAAA